MNFTNSSWRYLKNFLTEEKGTLVGEEILNLILEQTDSKHPLREYIKDKGGEIIEGSKIH